MRGDGGGLCSALLMISRGLWVTGAWNGALGLGGKPMSEQAILDRQTTQLDAINRSVQNLQLTAAETQEGDTEGRKTQQGNLAGRL